MSTQIELQQPDGSSNRLTVQIPAGVRDGQTIRLRGKGQPSPYGGAAGDLLIKLQVEPHKYFKREGNDLLLDVPISIQEAVLGAKIKVPTLDKMSTVTIPPGTSSGSKLRLRGKGVKPPKGKPGDLIIVIAVEVPKQVDKDSAELIEKFSSDNPQSPRDELYRGIG